MITIGFIGAGTVGTALAARLSSQGYSVVAVASRSRASADKLAQRVAGCQVYDNAQAVADVVDFVFITTPDAAIPEVAGLVYWHKGQYVVHCSGADSTASLDAARQLGASVGVIHPLQTFAGVDQAIQNLPGSTFALEAAEPLLGMLKEMATALGGYWIVLKANDKIVYHAAAVMACNYLVTLVKLATDMWQTFGVPPEQAIRAMMPLIKGTINNIETLGIPQCLTGPIARGDAGTVHKHLHALEKVAPDILSTYRELGLKTIPIALAKGKLNKEQAAQLAALLELPENNLIGGRVQ